jgi:uncharacterized membrane protein YphA (DoxX/SURF4 family)
MDLTLWIVAAALAAVFLLSGATKLLQPKDRLAATMDVLESLSPTSIKLVGTLEVLAAVGLLLPAVLDVAPVLVPLAAAGLVLLMGGAAVVHLRRRELPSVAVTLVLLALAAVVVWGRLGPESFTS